MPRGTISITDRVHSIPHHSPPYQSFLNNYSDVEVLKVQYRTKAESVRELLPAEVEIEDEPLAEASLIRYGMSHIGAYTEFVQKVEVTYNGTKYDYCLSIILDNEAAIYSGRERFGYPKIFGHVTFHPSMPDGVQPGFVHGKVERPRGVTIATLAFKPRQKTAFGPITPTGKRSLNLRFIPSPIPGAPPSVHEFVPAKFELIDGEVWTGEGSLNYSALTDFDPCHKVPVVRYEGATFVRRGNAHIRPVAETFKL